MGECFRRARLIAALGSLGLAHTDGGRPVQWYFDNLLPEEEQRDVVAKEAKINGRRAVGVAVLLRTVTPARAS